MKHSSKIATRKTFYVGSEGSRENQEEISNFNIFDDDLNMEYLCNLYPSEFKNISWEVVSMNEPISSTLAVDFKKDDLVLKKKFKKDPLGYFKEYRELKKEYFKDFQSFRRSDNGKNIEPIDPISFVMYGINGQNFINKTTLVEKISELNCHEFHQPHLQELMMMGSNDKVKISEILGMTNKMLNRIEKRYEKIKNKNPKITLKFKMVRLNIINSGFSVEKLIKKLIKEKNINFKKNGVLCLLPGEEVILNDIKEGSTVKNINKIKEKRGIEDVYSLPGLMSSRKNKIPFTADKEREREAKIEELLAIIEDMKISFKSELMNSVTGN